MQDLREQSVMMSEIFKRVRVFYRYTLASKQPPGDLPAQCSPDVFQEIFIHNRLDDIPAR